MPLHEIVVETWNGLLDLLYPPKCLVCGQFGREVVCERCRAGFLAVTLPICDRCGMTMETATERLCAECGAGAAWSFAMARSAGRYDGPLREAILRLKYREKPRLAVPLGAYLAAYLRTEPFGPEPLDLIVPVPLHRSRLRQRGFNQSALIAREVGRLLDLPVVEDVLRRVRRTRPQMELHASQRAANVRDAFAALESPTLQRKTVLLIDDILTTLVTCEECARVLVDAGAKTVYVVGVARGG